MSSEYEILIVDDVSENIKVAINILKQDGYNFSFALNGKEALEVLKTKRFDLVLLDIMMPIIDGFKVCKIIKNTPQIKDTPVIFVTAKIDMDSIEEGFKLGAVDYVTKPFHPTELKSRVKNHLELYRAKRQLKFNNINLHSKMKKDEAKYFTELELAQKEIISILSEIMEHGSSETAQHINRVSDISKLLATLVGTLSKEEINIVSLASPMHDIGKILIDAKLLHKPGKLDEEEYSQMKKHSQFAYDFFKKSDKELIKAAAIIAHQHHENYDGSGYPQGLVGNNIHVYGRIVAIADVLDALTHKRSYKEAWSFDEALKFIVDESGIKFDPSLVEVFVKHSDSFKKIVESS